MIFIYYYLNLKKKKKIVWVSLAGMAFPFFCFLDFSTLLSPPQTDPGSDCLLLYGFYFGHNNLIGGK